MEASFISVKEAKTNSIYQTDILDKFIDYSLELQSKRSKDGCKIYKLSNEKKTYIFKSISASLDDKEAVDEVKKEARLILKCTKLTDGIAKLISTKEIKDEGRNMYVREMLYEYNGVQLLSLKKNKRELMEIMKQVANTMSILEKEGIHISDLKPDSIIIKDTIAKILMIGNMMSFDELRILLERGKAIRDIYSPPEIIKSEKAYPEKINVYNWGIILYQVITNKTSVELETSGISYETIMDDIRELQIEDYDKPKLIEVLSRTLGEDPNERPSFKQLKSILTNENYEKEDSIDYKDILKHEYDKEEKPEEDYKLLLEAMEDPANPFEYFGEKVKRKLEFIKGGNTISYMQNRKLCDVGALALAKEMSKSKVLRVLRVGFNSIGVQGAVAIANGVVACKSLRELYLGGYMFAKIRRYQENNIGLKGAKAIAEATRSSRLEYLDLGYCNVPFEAADYIVSAGNYCTTLVWLCIEKNEELSGHKFPFRSTLEVHY